jgi:hypothetical protein
MSELYQSLSQVQMGLPVPGSLGAQTAAKVGFRAGTTATGCDLPRAGRQKECQTIEGHRMPDHVPVGMAIPPTFLPSTRCPR